MQFEKRPRTDQILSTHCHFCEQAPELVPRRYKDMVPFRGREFEIWVRDLYCPECGTSLVPDSAIQEQLEALTKAWEVEIKKKK